MNVPHAVAEVFKREGVEFLLAYPVNRIIEAAAALDIHPIKPKSGVPDARGAAAHEGRNDPGT